MHVQTVGVPHVERRDELRLRLLGVDAKRHDKLLGGSLLREWLRLQLLIE